MTDTSTANGVNAEDLRLFLDCWPRIAAEFEEMKRVLMADESIIFGKDAIAFSWHHLYELPIKDLMILPIAGLFTDEKFSHIIKELVASPSQIAALPSAIEHIKDYIEAEDEPSKEEIAEIAPMLGPFLGVSYALFNSLRCVLYHGCFLNELIQRIPLEDDKTLFDAVRIDPTVIGCKTVMARISKATMLQEVQFFSKLKAALTGKIAKREQANFQKMRLVFEVLKEVGATRLTDAQLHELFVEQLKLYSGNAKGGGNAKALRKFADTYMKAKATT